MVAGGEGMSEYRLIMRGIEKSFVSMKALENAELMVKPGEAHALLGINGAGKSTMIKILSGIYEKDAGEILIDGKPVEINSAQDAMACGIATVYQHPHLVYSFTGYECIFLGSESEGQGLLGKVNREALKKKAQELVREYNIDIDVCKLVSQMKPVEKELIAILSALAKDSKILILDEPTSILTEKEIDTLFELVRTLKARGVSVIFVTHRLSEVNKICETITVFRDGKNVAGMEVGEGLDASYIAELMLGKKMDALYPPKMRNQAEKAELELENISFENRLKDVSLKAYRGEILGVFGLVGSGIDELSKVIFGVIRHSAGSISVAGKALKQKSPKEAIRNKIFLVPGDRQTEGYVGDQSIANNIVMAKAGKICYKLLGFMNSRAKKRDALDMIERLSIATPNERKNVAGLSGGNQQKVVVGKGLYTDAEIYVFCEPTVGVDVGAKYSIYEIMRELAKEHVVILISSDVEEVFGMADRVMVLNQGRVTMEAEAEEVSLNVILVNAVVSA